MEELMHIWAKTNCPSCTWDRSHYEGDVLSPSFHITKHDGDGSYDGEHIGTHEISLYYGCITEAIQQACETRLWEWSIKLRDGFYFASIEDSSGDIFTSDSPKTIAPVAYHVLYAYIKTLRHQIA